MINQIEQAAQESSSLRAKLAAEKQILNRSEQVHISYRYHLLNIGNKCSPHCSDYDKMKPDTKLLLSLQCVGTLTE